MKNVCSSDLLFSALDAMDTDASGDKHTALSSSGHMAQSMLCGQDDWYRRMTDSQSDFACKHTDLHGGTGLEKCAEQTGACIPQRKNRRTFEHFVLTISFQVSRDWTALSVVSCIRKFGKDVKFHGTVLHISIDMGWQVPPMTIWTQKEIQRKTHNIFTFLSVNVISSKFCVL